MINTRHLLKVTILWVSIVDIVCFAGVALIPGIRPAFMYYALHTTTSVGENVMNSTTFISGLVIWNVFALLGVGLFAWLYNRR